MNLPPKPDQGQRNGSCQQCRRAGATWYNHLYRLYYCPECAQAINAEDEAGPRLGRMLYRTRPICTLPYVRFSDSMWRQIKQYGPQPSGWWAVHSFYVELELRSFRHLVWLAEARAGKQLELRYYDGFWCYDHNQDRESPTRFDSRLTPEMRSRCDALPEIGPDQPPAPSAL